MHRSTCPETDKPRPPALSLAECDGRACPPTAPPRRAYLRGGCARARPVPAGRQGGRPFSAAASSDHERDAELVFRGGRALGGPDRGKIRRPPPLPRREFFLVPPSSPASPGAALGALSSTPLASLLPPPGGGLPGCEDSRASASGESLGACPGLDAALASAPWAAEEPAAAPSPGCSAWASRRGGRRGFSTW